MKRTILSPAIRSQREARTERHLAVNFTPSRYIDPLVPKPRRFFPPPGEWLIVYLLGSFDAGLIAFLVIEVTWR